MWKRSIAVLCIAAFVAACDDDTPTPGGPPPPNQVYTYEVVDTFSALTFNDGVDIQSAGDSRLFVVEQAGRIIVFDKNDPDTSYVFLDISSIVTSGSELGLLGLAFHPDYSTNGWFYVYYTTGSGPYTARVARYSVTGDPNVADPASEDILLNIGERASNHNGGGLAFGGDGYLYVCVGDEGGGGDVYENAQNLTTLQGSVLRLDVDLAVDAPPYYEIPVDNPFAGNGNGWAEEIYAYGLRNPWRISYDAVSDRVWVGDVGQGQWEEVDVIVNGGNYGWDCREGAHPYTGPPDAPSDSCTPPPPGMIDPVAEYPHDGVDISITGGYVYRGPSLTSLTGRYIYADYGSGRVRALSMIGDTPGDVDLIADAPFSVSTFGTDENDELYIMQYSGSGRIHRLVQTEVTP